MPQSRQLAAIMFTDIVGYTALMGNDDQKAFSFLKKNREIQKPIIEELNGRWIKELGDGVMASFDSATNAVYAAIKIQEACNELNEFQLKIGIHLGDVLFENNDVLGDGVNIAARIEAATEAGCIFISEAVHNNIVNRQDIKTHFVREEILKNVSQPVRMYQVMFSGAKKIEAEKLKATIVENSIAVLPFANMSSDPDQEYFSDGISEEIINVLAQVPDMKVIGRTSSFAFKGKNQDLREIGKLLSVRYVLEGSVRKAGNKLRITAQLINVADGFHLYSEKFDRELEDVFAIQDEISLAILNAIKVKLLGGQKGTTLSKGPTNLEAYQLFLQGRYWFNKYHPEAFAKALEFYRAATDKDPNYALAYAEMAICYSDTAYFKWLPRDQCLPQAIVAANKALKLDDQCVESHIAVGRIKLWHEWDFAEGFKRITEANRINPNHVEGLRQLSFYNMLMGHYKHAHVFMQKAEEVDPFSLLNLTYLGLYCAWEGDGAIRMLEYADKLKALEPNYFGVLSLSGLAYNLQHKFDLSIPLLESAVKINPDMITLEWLGVAYGKQGEVAKARNVLEQMKNSAVADDSNIHIGHIYAAINEWEMAFEYFDKGVDSHEAHAVAINTWKQNHPEVVNDPRYAALAKKIGVPIN